MNRSEAQSIPIQKTKRNRKRNISVLILSIVCIWGVVYLFPVAKHVEHPFFPDDDILVIAHQGGEHLAPSNTLASFMKAKELGVDVIEFDIHMTKDGHLVTIHDDTVDRTTNRTGKVNDLTLEEIQALDAGHYFQDLDGNFSYRDEGIYIPTIEEVFDSIPNMKWNIEIKDTNDPELYRLISEQLWETIQQYNLEEQTLIASFDQDIIDIMNDVSDNEALVSGGRSEITKFVVLHKLFLNGIYRPNADAVQIPTSEGKISLTDRKLIRGANKRGMDVHYWTINDEETMQTLIDLGANGILTDRPDLLLNIIEENNN